MKLIICLMFGLILTGCKSGKNSDTENQSDSEESHESATVRKYNFYDFFYKFISDKNYRAARVKDKDLLNKIFFPGTDFTIHIYPGDSVEFKEFEEDLTSRKVYSVISASTYELNNFNFLKENNEWYLASADQRKLDISDDSKFIPFLLRFSKDTVYQKKHIRYPLKSSFLDYENDYADTTVYLLQREVYAKNFLVEGYIPFLHSGEILNTDYNNATVYFRGNGNGIYIECQFNFIDGEWFMVEEKDFST